MRFGWHKFYSIPVNKTERIMAHIDVQKKKSNPLPWILLLLVIAAIAGYFIWRNMNNPAGTATTVTDTTTNATTNPALGSDTTRTLDTTRQ
jgi:hypothetical protein